MTRQGKIERFKFRTNYSLTESAAQVCLQDTAQVESSDAYEYSPLSAGWYDMPAVGYATKPKTLKRVDGHQSGSTSHPGSTEPQVARSLHQATDQQAPAILHRHMQDRAHPHIYGRRPPAAIDGHRLLGG